MGNITTAVPSGIQTPNKDINIRHHPLLQRLQVLRAKKLRMNLTFEPHQPILGARDEVQRTAADAESRVSFVLADVGADAVDVCVGAGVVEGERVGGYPYYRACGLESVNCHVALVTVRGCVDGDGYRISNAI
jgi:hypothetical protein